MFTDHLRVRDPLTGELRPYTKAELAELRSINETVRSVEERDKISSLPLGVHNVLSPHELQRHNTYVQERQRQAQAQAQAVMGRQQMPDHVPSFLDPKEGWNASQVARGEILRDSDLPVERRLSMVAEELQRGGLVSPPMAVYTTVVDARAVVLELREKIVRQRQQAVGQWIALTVLAGLVFFFSW